jgi:peptidoglycan/xylan/chitin deacetylase (PgdA/CDA1 family)
VSLVTGALHLTFDDGPDARWTPRVLAELERCGARASFFMVGERALEEPDLVRTVLAAGHSVELHCHRHVRHTELSERELERDTELGLCALEHGGARPVLWRAPWGLCSDASGRVAQKFGLRLVGWSIDTHDWRGDEPQSMLVHVRERLADGRTVLLHDALGPGALRRDCANTTALLPGLIAAARERGLEPVPINDRLATVCS